jgi:hypothetical protein
LCPIIFGLLSIFLLPDRCQELSNGAMIPAVADFGAVAPVEGGAAGADSSGAAVAPAQLREQGGQGPAAAQRHTGFTDKLLLTPEELREKLK